jgi:hypothetical protein
MRALAVTLASILAIGLLSPAVRLQEKARDKGGEEETGPYTVVENWPTPWAQPAAAALVSRMNGPLIALTLQPEDDPPVLPSNPLSEGDLVIFAVFIVLLGIVFGFDIVRTWWDTNEWRREYRRRRRQPR